MQPTTALRMFQPTKRMMRPVPVSFGVPESFVDITDKLGFTEGRAEWYVFRPIHEVGEAGRIYWKSIGAKSGTRKLWNDA